MESVEHPHLKLLEVSRDVILYLFPRRSHSRMKGKSSVYEGGSDILAPFVNVESGNGECR